MNSTFKFFNKKILVLGATLLLSNISFADTAVDDYNNTTPGAGTGNTPAIARVNRDAENIACEGNLCKIFSITVNSRKFTVSANVGDMSHGGGSSSSSYGGYYGGYYGGGVGTGVETNPSYGLNTPFGFGIGVTWENTNCTKVINVDRSVYDSVTTYMKLLVNHDGTTNPAFTPAEQTMIVFYTTMMQLIKGTSCN